MALAAVQTAMNHEGNQSLHPFFSKPPRDHAPLEDLSTNETLANDVNDDLDYELDPTNAQPPKTRKKRTRKTDNAKEKKGGSSHTKNQASLERFTRPAQAQLVDQTVSNDAAVATLEEDPNVDRIKRRKTASPAPVDASTITMPGLDWHQQLQVDAQGPTPQEPLPSAVETIEKGPEVLLRAASPMTATTSLETLATVEESGAMENKVDNVTPKKQIRVTKSGRLVSSPPKPVLQESTAPKKRRGRKPAKAKLSSTVTIIRYGSDATSRHTIGGRIDAILAGIKLNGKESATTKEGTAKPAEPPKSTHPFFLGKSAQKAEEAPTNPVANMLPPTPRKSAVTPGKLRAEARRDCSPDPMPAFGTSIRTNKGTKQSGLFEACWPTRETSHVRNLDITMAHPMEVDMTRTLPLRARKLKNRVVTLGDREEVISRLARDIASGMRTKNEELDFKPPEDVRLPTRLLTTGVEIQRRVQEHLHSRLEGTSDQGTSLPLVHPAVELLLNDIEHTLTPFDEGRCEGQAWAQKYSPKCASHVLSESKDATVLRDWLQSLTVLAVGGAQGTVKADIADIKRPPKKKRKKAVDNFIVSDDEEEDEEMMAISDREDAPYPRSFRRPRWTRNNNVILISGPHGCGKSATVYAVAKELEFEVFEINSGTRRSGKDIQDRVGDMTANHLVNHKREAATQQEALPANDNDTDSERMDTACQQDIDSGRQGTMMSFFKANSATKTNPKPKPKPQTTKTTTVTAVQSSLTKLNGPQKSQKQSLILFEEADILFEEDQQFWAHVTKLAANSKRPIVITCNDERQIPLHDLPLAAVLRLHPPPVDLATDYLLVLAGREGHILERQAVTDLYKSKKHDLRSSIAELSFWCQISVGDRKGGLEWMYQRWPPGKDMDEHGRLLRVASEDTYESGMGWLSHNVFETKSSTAFDKEEELLNEVWADWGVDPTTWAASSSNPNLRPQSNSLRDLERMDLYAETLSAADVYCRVDLPSYTREHDQPADATLPLIFDRARLSYTLAAPLLQADQQTDFLQFDTSIYTQTQLLARRTFPEFTSPFAISTSEKLLAEADYSQAILCVKEAKSKERSLSRFNFSWAFDVLAAPPDQTLPERTSFILTPSSFDRTFSIITLDLAPYVRSIVAHEQILESQRIRMSNLLSGGGIGKRARTTRASRVALEGGVRESKRRDRWFEAEVNFGLVMATAGKDWTGMGWRNEEEELNEGTGSVTGTQESLTGSQDVMMQDVGEEQHYNILQKGVA